MEYLIGSLLTLFTMLVLSRKVARVHKENVPVLVKYSQSHTYTLLKPVLPYILTSLKQNAITQSKNYERKHQIRVIFTSDEAYWISSNSLYVAKLVDGVVDEDSAKVVDTMSMDKVQLDKMVFIVEQLTEGLTNDSSNPGD
jgi:hypothetical protein